jgi:predicted amidohydrolase
MATDTLRIGLASPRPAASRQEALATVDRFLSEAATRGAKIVCFPETYMPGYRSPDFPTPPPDQAAQENALERVRELAGQHAVAVILPMEWQGPAGLLNIAVVINADGSIQGYQTKNQIPPEEEPYYTGGEFRRMFEVEGVPFGIVICHEGSRYPETVRWAVSRGARIVFHPHLSGNDQHGQVSRFWGDPEAPYYEKAMVTRAVENEIYFASVNYALRYQESATSLISPDGECVAHTPYGEEALLVADLDLLTATGIYAERFNPNGYRESESPGDELPPRGIVIPGSQVSS